MSLRFMWRSVCAVIALLPAASWACDTDPDRERAALSADTAREIVHRLWDAGDCESATLQGFSSGDSRWLAFAVAVKPYTDAWSSESLTASLSFAMLRAPSRVLPLVDQPAFGTRICVADFFDDSPEGIKAFWNRLPSLRSMFEAFVKTSLGKQARICLGEVERLEKREDRPL
jgi:hypothetical protein